jgi:hypothetical protein
MAIKGLTDQAASFAEIGTLRKGGKKVDEKKPGPDLKEYLRFVTHDQAAANAFTAAFGDEGGASCQAKEIEFYLPFATVEENLEAWREQYGAGGLIHRCDGETCTMWRDDRGIVHLNEPVPCPTPTPEQRKAGGCKQVARLKIIILELKRFAFVTLTTTSIYDIIALHRNLLAIQMINGTLRNVPLILRRVEKEISTPGADGKRARYKKWLLSIEPHPEWQAKKMLEHRQSMMQLAHAANEPLLLESGDVTDDDDDDDDDLIHEGIVDPPHAAQRASLADDLCAQLTQLLLAKMSPDDVDQWWAKRSNKRTDEKWLRDAIKHHSAFDRAAVVARIQELGYALVKAGDTTAGDLGDMSTLDDQTLKILLKDFQERVADIEGVAK